MFLSFNNWFCFVLENHHRDVIGSELNPIIVVDDDDEDDDDDGGNDNVVNDDDDEEEYYDWMPLELSEFVMLRTYVQHGGK